jgi:hypothetical protein
MSPNRSRDRLSGRGESDRDTGGNRRRRSTQTRFEPNDSRRGGTRDLRPQGPGARALPVRQVPRQRRLDRDRRARAQPPAVDDPDRTTRHRHPDRADSPLPTAHRSRPDHPHRTHSDTQDASPLAVGIAFLAALQRLRVLPTIHRPQRIGKPRSDGSTSVCIGRSKRQRPTDVRKCPSQRPRTTRRSRLRS